MGVIDTVVIQPDVIWGGGAVIVLSKIVAIEVLGQFDRAPSLLITVEGHSPAAHRLYGDAAKAAAVSLSAKFPGLAGLWVSAEANWLERQVTAQRPDFIPAGDMLR